MLVSHDREKLIEAIKFFAANTRHCGKVKLFKLLYFLDFEHYKSTGRSVTGLDYSAWPLGPVPVALHEEIEEPNPDMSEAVAFTNKAFGNGKSILSINAKSPFSDRNFSRRELALMRKLVEEYRDTYADGMVEATHLENTPWDKIYVQQGLRQHPIPYELALRADDAEAVGRVIAERAELVDLLG